MMNTNEKSKYRLLALDLDGTLTNHQKQVSEKNKLYIAKNKL